MDNNDTKKLNDLLKQLGIKIEDKNVISTLGLYFDDSWDVASHGVSLEMFSNELLQDIYEGKKISGFHYEEYNKEKESLTSNFRVLVGKKLSIEELINIAGDSIGNYIKPEYLDNLRENDAQLAVVFNDDNTIKSLSELHENDITVDSPEAIFKIIDDMKKIKSEKGSISPADALKNALNNTTIEQISEATNLGHSKDHGEQTHDER